MRLWPRRKPGAHTFPELGLPEEYEPPSAALHPPRRGMQLDPAQVPKVLMQPAMDAGQPAPPIPVTDPAAPIYDAETGQPVPDSSRPPTSEEHYVARRLWPDDEDMDYLMNYTPGADGTPWISLRCSVHGPVQAATRWDLRMANLAAEDHYVRKHLRRPQ